MTKTIKNNNDLQKVLKKQLYKWMVNIKEKLPDYLEEFIISEYYDQYSPKMYERKFRILEAIMTSEIRDIGNGYEFELYLDPTRVSYDPSFWTSHGVTYYIKGDDADDVFRNMSQGIHGSTEFGVTSGRFWEKFLDEIGEGGIYDIFKSFKKYLSDKCKIKIN
ncbi:hypothetical protein [Konateibacter massiliensis]|uniref:hypothetical protein n=1 Tax=Konateibacter massiliensis TaxID=2002841 RepID=UPI000C155B2A|nr:hypothetical protein [Konateibacter massiliensis]